MDLCKTKLQYFTRNANRQHVSTFTKKRLAYLYKNRSKSDIFTRVIYNIIDFYCKEVLVFLIDFEFSYFL